MTYICWVFPGLQKSAKHTLRTATLITQYKANILFKIMANLLSYVFEKSSFEFSELSAKLEQMQWITKVLVSFQFISFERLILLFNGNFKILINNNISNNLRKKYCKKISIIQIRQLRQLRIFRWLAIHARKLQFHHRNIFSFQVAKIQTNWHILEVLLGWHKNEIH